jgi:hypothetical protein
VKDGKRTGAIDMSAIQRLIAERHGRSRAAGRRSTRHSSATAPKKAEGNLLPLARSSFTRRLFWGEQPPLTPVGCGGRSLFDPEVGSPDLEPHYGIEPTVRFLTLFLGGLGSGGSDFLIWVSPQRMFGCGFGFGFGCGLGCGLGCAL